MSRDALVRRFENTWASQTYIRSPSQPVIKKLTKYLLCFIFKKLLSAYLLIPYSLALKTLHCYVLRRPMCRFNYNDKFMLNSVSSKYSQTLQLKAEILNKRNARDDS